LIDESAGFREISMRPFSQDFTRSYGDTDCDRLLATPRTIAICWCGCAVLMLAAGLADFAPMAGSEGPRSIAQAAPAQHAVHTCRLESPVGSRHGTAPI
jgi:hypothetical protein